MKISFAAILLVILCNFSSSQWRQTDGPNTYGGVIRPMILSGNTLYVVVPAYGLYVSSNNGNSWIKISSNLAATVYCAAADGNKIYIGTNLGLYTSPIQNISWTLAQNIGLNDTDFLSITVKGNKIYAGTIDGVYLSTNSGNSWSHILTISTGPVAPIVIDSVNNNTNYIYAGSLHGLYMSLDNGASWTSPLPYTIYGIAANGQYIVVSIGLNNNLVRSTNYGINWVSPGLYGSFYAVSSDGNKFYAGGSGLYESTDNGSTWNNLPLTAEVSSIASNGQNIIVGTNGTGVDVTTNGGQNWSNNSTGLIPNPVNCLMFAGNRLIAGTGGGGIYITDNNGRNWSNSYSGAFLEINRFTNSGSNYYALNSLYIYSSSDSGANWYFGGDGGSCFDVKDNIILEGVSPNGDKANGGIYYSANFGGNWTETYSCISVNSVKFIGSNAFASTACAVLFSTNNGLNWSNISSGLLNTFINQFYNYHNKVYAAMSSTGVYYTTDNGTTWIPVNTGLTDLHTKCFASNNENLFVCTNNGIYRTIDDGAHWTSYNLNLPDSASVMSLAMNGNNLFAGTQSDKVWMTTISEFTGIKQNDNSIPKNYALYQNYPNPFNPSTKIYYDLPVESNVKLVVYDIVGKEVKTIVNAKQNAGKYQVDFDGNNFASGVYFYKLQTGSFTETKKMLMIK